MPPAGDDNPMPMTPDQFAACRKAAGLSQAGYGKALGVSAAMVRLYERGRRYEDNREVTIPRTVELAAAAFALGIKSYEGPQR